MSINIETTTTQQTTSDELDLLAKHLCGVKLTLSDSGVPTIQADSISTNGITASTTNTYSDTVAALALKGVTVNYTNQNLRILDPNVKSVLLANNIGDGTYITPAQAAVANISTMFKNNANIVAFDEFRSFTSQQSRSTQFSGCTSLTRIDVTDLMVWGNDTFNGCTNLEYFHGSGSTQGVLNIPIGVTSIGNYALKQVGKVTKLTIPDTVTSLGIYCCQNMTSLNEVTIGSGVTTIYYDAFIDDSALSRVNISDLSAWLNITYDGIFRPQSNPLFYAHHLYLNDSLVTSINFPQGTTTIKPIVMAGCTDLTAVTIPSTVTSIGSNAFYGCSNLAISDLDCTNITDLGNDAFGDVSITYAHGLSGLTKIGSCFNGAKIGTLDFPQSITKIEGNYSFNSGTISVLNLESVDSYVNMTIPFQRSAPAYIATAIKHNGSLVEHYSFPQGTTSVKNNAMFCFKDLTQVTIPNTVTSIGEYAFNNCKKLQQLDIPDSVTTIENNAFSQCTALTTVVLGSGITNIKYQLVYNDWNITSFTIKATNPPTCETNTFQYCSVGGNNCTIYVPAGSVSAYQSAPVWSNFASRIQAIPT